MIPFISIRADWELPPSASKESLVLSLTCLSRNSSNHLPVALYTDPIINQSILLQSKLDHSLTTLTSTFKAIYVELEEMGDSIR